MKKKFIQIMVVLSFVALCSGCINNSDQNENNSEKNYCKYELILTPNTNNSYNLFLPLILENDSPSNLNDEITIIEGSADYNIIQTERGWGYNLSASEKITLILDKISDENLPNIQLSMNSIKKNYLVKYYIYCYKNTSIDWIDVNINFEYKSTSDTPKEIQTIQGRINDNGWTIIDGDVENVMP